MESKTWLWRKKSSDKTFVTSDKADFYLKGIEEETLLTEKEVGLVRSMKNVNEKLPPVPCDCNAKDDLVTIHVKMAEEAIAGREKAVAEVVVLKQELEEAAQLGIAARDAALKECTQQLACVKEEQEQRIQDAIMKASTEFEKTRKKLEEKLTDSSKKLANLASENTHLSNALLVKEKFIEDLRKWKSQTEAECSALMSRLDSTEKENAFLKYEFRMLEKELEIRNEEREFDRRTADSLQKQHLDSMKKITKLEAECQRLHDLLRKRVPGSASLAKMNNDFGMLGRDRTEMRRRKQMNSTQGGLIVRGSTQDNSHETTSKRVSFLIEWLRGVEEENKTLKELITNKNNELHASRITWAQTSSKLTQIETQLGELSRGQISIGLESCSPISKELSLTPHFYAGNGNEVSNSGSWSNALISDMDHFRNEKPKSTHKHKSLGVPDMNLMDDFAEMEKLAIVSVDTPFGSSRVSSDANNAIENSLGKELVPVVDGDLVFGDTKSFDWLQDVLKAILDQNHVSGRSLDELLEDIRISLAYINRSSTHEADTTANSTHSGEADPLQISGYITWKSPNTSPVLNSHKGLPSIDTSMEETSNQKTRSNLRESIGKIITLVEEINLTSLMDNSTTDNGSERNRSPLISKYSAVHVDYLVCVFQWKRSELNDVLQQFIHTCNDLLNGEVGVEKFAGELAFALNWVINNCITHQDVSSMRSKLKSQKDDQFSKSDECHVEQSTVLPLFASSDGQNVSTQMENIESYLQEESWRLKDELKSMEVTKNDLEVRLQTSADKSGALTNQLQESKQSIERLQTELENLKYSKGVLEDQVENQKMINEDLDTQLRIAKFKLNKVLQKFSSLEVELEDKNNCCEELEGTCLELQLQLESTTKEIPKYHIDQEENQIRSGWEITTASVKLAECQETILSVGKQLKALASPREAALIDKVFSTSTTTTTTSNDNNSSKQSLRDQMLADEDGEEDVFKSPMIKEIISTNDTKDQNASKPPNAYLGSNHKAGTGTVGALAIVASKKRGGGVGFLRKLLMRRKKGSGKKTFL